MRVHPQYLVRILGGYDVWVVVPISQRCNLICLAGMLLPGALWAETLRHESMFDFPIQQHLQELKYPSSKVTVPPVRRATLQVFFCFVLKIKIQSPLTCRF